MACDVYKMSFKLGFALGFHQYCIYETKDLGNERTYKIMFFF